MSFARLSFADIRDWFVEGGLGLENLPDDHGHGVFKVGPDPGALWWELGERVMDALLMGGGYKW